MKNIFLIIILLLFSKCLHNDAKHPIFEIINNSDSIIDSVLIIAHSGTSENFDSDTLIFKNLSINKSYKKTLFLENVKSDGVFGYKVYNQGRENYEGGFDYFTNGASMKKGYILEIRKDTTFSKFIGL